MIKNITVLIFFLLISCQSKDIIKLEGRTMGTTFKVLYIPESNSPDMKILSSLVQKELKRVNDLMSTYKKDSEISRVNIGPANNWLGISRDLTLVLAEAKEIHDFSNGYYDVTVGPLVNLWGFGPKGEKKAPTQEEIDLTLKKVGMDQLVVLSDKNRIMKKNKDLYIDLSSLAKGYGVDQVSATLDNLGIKNYLVEVGGEISLRGTKYGTPWKVAIEGPNDKEGIHKILPLSDINMATSGNYRNFFEEDGKRYSHTLDIKTGRPVLNELISVTVLSKKSCMRADALATAIMAMGREKGIQLSQDQKLAVYMLVMGQNGKTEIYSTPEFKKLVP